MCQVGVGLPQRFLCLLVFTTILFWEMQVRFPGRELIFLFLLLDALGFQDYVVLSAALLVICADTDVYLRLYEGQGSGLLGSCSEL